MVNKRNWLGILVMVLVFGMTVVGCGNENNDCVHIWEWKVTIPATETTNGVRTRTCSHCGETGETQSIPAIGSGIATCSDCGGILPSCNCEEGTPGNGNGSGENQGTWVVSSQRSYPVTDGITGDPGPWNDTIWLNYTDARNYSSQTNFTSTTDTFVDWGTLTRTTLGSSRSSTSNSRTGNTLQTVTRTLSNSTTIDVYVADVDDRITNTSSDSTVTIVQVINEESGLTQRTTMTSLLDWSSETNYIIELIGVGDNEKTYKWYDSATDGTTHTIYRMRNDGVVLEVRSYNADGLRFTTTSSFPENAIIRARLPSFTVSSRFSEVTQAIDWYSTYELVSYSNTELVILTRSFSLGVLSLQTETTYRRWSGPNRLPDLTPIAADFEIDGWSQTIGRVTEVTITPKVGSSNGTINSIFYDGSATLPTAVGTYAITINIASASGWNATESLFVGILAINPLAANGVYDGFQWRREGDRHTIEGGGITITGYIITEGGNVTIPAIIDYSPVVSIGSSAFRSRQLTSIFIPDSVIFIGDRAFENNLLINVTIPNGVTSIELETFRNNQLVSVFIPNGVISIGRSAFSNNQLSSVVIPGSVSSIGDSAFQVNQLASVTINNGVDSIGMAAFANNQLNNVVIPDSVSSIEQYAFAQNQLVSVTIGGGVALGVGAFGFESLYSSNGMLAGTYTRPNTTSWTWARQ